MQTVLCEIAQILTVDRDRAPLDIVEAEQQAPDGGFARPRRADHGHGAPCGRIERDPLEDRTRRVITEHDIAEPHRGPGDLQITRIGFLADIRFLFQQAEHLRHVDQRLPDLAIDRAEEIQAAW